MGWSVLVLFLAIQIAIGIWAGRRVKSEEDYVVAGRRLGLPLVTMSMFATWFGAESCLGASGMVYDSGLSGGRGDPFGYSICLLLVAFLLAVPLHRQRYLTLGDLYRERFGKNAERVLVFVLVAGSLIWGAAQLRALGQIVVATSDLSSVAVDEETLLPTAIVLSTLFVVAYTSFGGLWGDVLSDLVQGSVLCVGLVLLLAACLLDLPDDAALGQALSPERLSLWPAKEGVLTQIDRWAVPILGSLATQEMASRVLAARSPEIARRGAASAALVFLVFGSIPVVLGLLGRAVLPELADGEQLLPLLARQKLPTALYLLFACALLSAILTTIDSILLSAATLLSRNWLVPAFGIQREAHKLWLDRALVAVCGLLALWLALGAKSIQELLQQSALLGGPGLVVTILCAIYTKRRSQLGAVAALIIGTILALVFERWNLDAPFLGATAVAAGCYMLGAWFEGRHVRTKA